MPLDTGKRGPIRVFWDHSHPLLAGLRSVAPGAPRPSRTPAVVHLRMKPSGMAPKGPPMTPGPSHHSSSPPRTQPSLSWLFRQAVTFPSVLTSPTCAPMSSEPSPMKQRHSESSCSSSLPSNPTLVLSDALRVQRCSSVARLPTRGSANAAGYDLYSAEAKIVRARGQALVDTQLSVAVPPGTYGRVAPRSGLASKLSIDVGAGVINADYQGIVYVLLVNHSENDFEVSVGDCIAQLILERVSTPPVLEVWDLNNHPQTPSASIAHPSHLEQSPTLEIEDMSPQRASPSSPAPRVRLPVNQVVGGRDPCPHWGRMPIYPPGMY